MKHPYELMIEQLGLKSVLDIKIHWRSCFQWLGRFPWVSRIFDNVATWLVAKKGLPYEL